MTVLSGLTNMVLDALLVAVFPLGLQGAAAATAIGQCVGGIVPVIYFCRPNSSLLRLGKTEFDGKALLKACTNGSSEFVSNISMSMVSMLYNVQLLRYAGEDGVAAYGVLMYVNLIFLAAFIGYSVGTAPVIGYHYGAGNHRELKGLLKRSLVLVGISSVVMLAAGEILARPLSQIFYGYDHAGLCHLLLFLPVCRSWYFWLLFFHGAEQRVGFRRHFFSADPGVPGGGGAGSAPILEAGRHMDVHGGRRAAGDCRYRSVFDKQAETVPLLRMCHKK